MRRPSVRPFNGTRLGSSSVPSRLQPCQRNVDESSASGERANRHRHPPPPDPLPAQPDHAANRTIGPRTTDTSLSSIVVQRVCQQEVVRLSPARIPLGETYLPLDFRFDRMAAQVPGLNCRTRRAGSPPRARSTPSFFYLLPINFQKNKRSSRHGGRFRQPVFQVHFPFSRPLVFGLDQQSVWI